MHFGAGATLWVGGAVGRKSTKDGAGGAGAPVPTALGCVVEEGAGGGATADAAPLVDDAAFAMTDGVDGAVMFEVEDGAMLASVVVAAARRGSLGRAAR